MNEHLPGKSAVYWLILGGGVSGLGAAKWLRANGKDVRISDGRPLDPAMRQAFVRLGVEVYDNGHDLTHLRGIDAVVVSPGITPNHLLIKAANDLRIPLISEVDLALQSYHGQLLGVTGTNGKSTTCAMLGYLFSKTSLNATVGGNFGDPPTAMLAEHRAGDLMILELSSYQLEQSVLIAPDAAIFTSFSYDHLARHGSLAGYLKAKWRLFQKMAPEAMAILPDYVFEFGRREGLSIPCHTVVVGRDLKIHDGGIQFANGERVDLLKLGIKEPQNQLNAAFALVAATHLTKKPALELAPLLAGFRGLPHRCEMIGTLNTHAVINDSKSTNVESTLVALKSQDRPVLLMMGGQGKGEPYQPILKEKQHIAAVITFGASGDEIAQALQPTLPVYKFPTLKAAITAIPGILKESGSRPVLFSPGCASFDEFANYEARGQYFRHAMQGLGMTDRD